MKYSKKSLISSVIILLFVITAYSLKAKFWKDYIVDNANKVLWDSGFQIDNMQIEGHLLKDIYLTDIIIKKINAPPINIEKVRVNIGLFRSLFNDLNLDILTVESGELSMDRNTFKMDKNNVTDNLSLNSLIDVRSFYFSIPISYKTFDKVLPIKLVLGGELNRANKPLVVFDLLNINYLETPFQEINLTNLNATVSDSAVYFKKISGNLFDLPISGSATFNLIENQINGEINLNNFSISKELFSRLPLQTKFSKFSGKFLFESDLENLNGTIDLQNDLGLDMQGEFIINKLEKSSYALKKLSLIGEESKLIVSGFIDNKGRLNSYLNLENLNIGSWLDADIKTSLTGLAILDGSIANNGSFDQIDLTLEILETEYFEVGETSFHGQVSYQDSILLTRGPVLLLIDESELSIDGEYNFRTDNINIISELENADIHLVNQFLPQKFQSGKATGSMKIDGSYLNPSVKSELTCRDIIFDEFFLSSIELNSYLPQIGDNDEIGNISFKVGNGSWKKNTFDSGTFDATINGEKIILDNCHFKSGKDFLQFSGDFDGLNSYRLDRFQLAVEDNYLVNFKPLFFKVQDSIKNLELEPFVFHINDGILEGVIKQNSGIYCHLKMSNFDASIITQYFEDERLQFSGMIFGELIVKNNKDNLEIDVDVTMKRGTYMEEKFDEMIISFLYKDGILNMDDISMIRGDLMGVQATGVVPISNDKSSKLPILLNSTFTNVSLSLINKFLPDFYKINGNATGSVNLNGFPNKTKFDYNLSASKFFLDKIKLGEVKLSGNYDSQKLYLNGLALKNKNDSLVVDGYLPFDLNISSEYFGSLIQDNEFDFMLNSNSSSLYFLTPYIEDLDSLNGDINLTLNISGKSNDIRRNGTIKIMNGVAYTLLLNNPINRISGQANMINNILEIDTLVADAVHSSVGAKSMNKENMYIKGNIDFSLFFSPSYDLKIKGEGSSFKILPIDVTGLSNLDIEVSGRDTVFIDGTIEAMNATLFYEFTTADVGESINQDHGPIIVYNLTFPLRERVLFQNSQVDALLKGELKLNKVGYHDMNFDGEIFVEDGSVFSYKDNFKELRGYVTFDNNGFNPYMDLAAYTDIDNERIKLQLLGGVEDLDILLESESGFSESDILELLTWGKRFEEDLSNNGGFGYQTATVLGSLLENELEKNLENISNIGAMNLIDDIDISGTASLGKDDENFAVTAKRKIGDKTYLNLSYKRSFSLQSQIGVEYKLNRHFSVVGNIDDAGKLKVKYRYRYAY